MDEHLIFLIAMAEFSFVMLFLIYQSYRQWQSINALGDFVNDKLNEMDTEIQKSKEWETQVQAFILDQVLPELAYQDYKIDAITYDFHRHLVYALHLDEKNKPFRPTTLINKELTLCTLENSVRERAEKYKDKINTIRPEGI